ncbi:PQQ-dependent sugar dehydrogenase [soil metagenome]
MTMIRPGFLLRAFTLSLLAGGSAPALAQTAAAAGAPIKIKAEVIAKGLSHPWALAFIDAGRMLVTERSGDLRLVQAGGQIGPPIQGLPRIEVAGQGGLLDIIADSKFSRNRTIYFCYSEPSGIEGKSGAGNSTALASARLSDDGKKLEQFKVIFSQYPKVASTAHFGCRIVENPDGTLFLTLGERFSRKQDAQTLDNHLGKVVRIRKDGGAPPDNPFVGTPAAGNKALPEIWSYGHRNMQGATLGPDGRLWTHEHGPQGGDEINRPEAGKNYGWPVITYGENYGGGKIGEGLTAKPGMEQPVHYWTPSIAPSGMSFLRSSRYGEAWRNNLFIGSLKFHYLARIELRDGKVVREEKLLQEVGERIRDVREGPDGLLYVLTDEDAGQLLRLVPSR